tara:strand:+ start:9057 stop:9650 length:594 start_codon:yes stop_codon:yes gene_type:complete
MEKKLRILAASDLHGKRNVIEKLAQKASKEKVDLVILAGDIQGSEELNKKVLEPFKKVNKKVVFIPGNWESKEEHEILRKQTKSIDDYYVTYNNVGIAGIGSEEWKMEFDKSDLEKIIKNFKRMKPKKKVLVSHLHASGTKAEFLGIEGDKILREAIKKVKPDLLISAHIHEAEGMEDRIGKTRVVQVGKNGKILEI